MKPSFLTTEHIAISDATIIQSLSENKAKDAICKASKVRSPALFPNFFINFSPAVDKVFHIRSARTASRSWLKGVLHPASIFRMRATLCMFIFFGRENDWESIFTNSPTKTTLLAGMFSISIIRFSLIFILTSLAIYHYTKT
ncbi:MAG: hypothetical protein A2268_15170 [Candidatus Raymondbacteria bacterium RifOxyA12_full_50_37]|nr:MAG: hypothetical protein A2268_15170 [Candidatus Raymondbacteria bacterium RifOxyA12_full_50_37]OGJ88503.1 MAG: hypothetical protein A2248_20090 [Candidatus Raymondbacteria bacterium RIFOXYA2_FULL_49_16]OGJ90614.1 MAG: hypothetical protein A2350_18420 [Candidatus Raymondbacteria bacterium RifOxyB12_full_50_8]OGJ96184.1 MAG: hypothetical protein A2487_01350 [Candidatus Raymondbacteria bacterium RifOxyC12_full_50_8]OGJ98964.1 MAG: hypothetical protein A2453_10810 [Candidatus Raymondbacteria b